MKPENLTLKKTINCRGIIIDFEVPKVMGILNITPDSFYDGGKYSNLEEIHRQFDNLISEGADIVDIGAVSSKPGATLINLKEEIKRLVPVLKLVLKNYPNTVVSIDTFRSEIAELAVRDYGVSIINDISSGSMDDMMFETIAKLQVPYVIMHMQGNPADMQQNPIYKDVVKEIMQFFSKKLLKLRTYGIHDIIIDPGFGFGKTMDHNYQLLSRLEEFKMIGLPLMLGLSRKSMIYKYFNCEPDDALNGTTVLHTIALMKNANILRVHDVLEAKQAVKLVQKNLDASNGI
jgi:dihydropteroate synthase